ADEPELGDIADLDAVQLALLVDVDLRAAQQIEELDPPARHRADLEQRAMRRHECSDDRRTRISGRLELAIRDGCGRQRALAYPFDDEPLDERRAPRLPQLVVLMDLAAALLVLRARCGGG